MQLSKGKITKILCVVIFVLSLILNISLLTSDVYEGKYVAKYGKEDTYKTTVEFDGGAYTVYKWNKTEGRLIKFTAGFYFCYGEKNKVIELQDRAYVVSSSSYYEHTLNRNSVFCLTLHNGEGLVPEDTKLYCYEAIFLQVLYLGLITASVVLYVVERKKCEY